MGLILETDEIEKTKELFAQENPPNHIRYLNDLRLWGTECQQFILKAQAQHMANTLLADIRKNGPMSLDYLEWLLTREGLEATP